MGIGADHELAREGVLLQRHLVDDAGAWPPEAHAILGSSRAQKVVDLAVFCQRLPEVRRALEARLDKVIAVDARRHSGLAPTCLHELEHSSLAQDILENHPIWPELHIALAAFEVSVGWVIKMRQEDFLGQSHRPTQTLAHRMQGTLHPLVHTRNKFRRGFYRNHVLVPLGTKTAIKARLGPDNIRLSPVPPKPLPSCRRERQLSIVLVALSMALESNCHEQASPNVVGRQTTRGQHDVCTLPWQEVFCSTSIRDALLPCTTEMPRHSESQGWKC